jgi:hypothetical protein
MASPADLLARLDAVLAELAALREEVAAVEGTIFPSSSMFASTIVEPNDLSEGNLLDTHAASARFGYPRDTIALWCRQGDGVKVGGRWMASVPRLQRRLNGSG